MEELLRNNGFNKLGEYWQIYEPLTITIHNPFEDYTVLYIDGYEQEQANFIWKECLKYDNPIEKLLSMIKNEEMVDKQVEPGFIEGNNNDEKNIQLVDYKIDKNRKLLIYTWGRAVRKSLPFDSQHNFFAGQLNGRGHGVDLRRMNGKFEEIQIVVSNCGRFYDFMLEMLKKIETKNLSVISIYCTKGRHRSVAAAELLKKYYYADATIKHLDIC